MRFAYLVEDSAAIRADLIPALEELASFGVIAFAESESEAVAWLVSHCSEAELVVLDVFLKEGTGLGVLSRQAEFPPDRRFVVLTNSATAQIRKRCKQLGAHAVFDKTAELDEFFDFCRKLPDGG